MTLDKTLQINLQTEDVVIISIRKGAASDRAEIMEAEALRRVLDQMQGTCSASLTADAVAAITSPEGVKRLLIAALEAKVVPDDLRSSFQREWTVRSHRIREMFGDDRLLSDVLRRFLPPYVGQGSTIYRGEQAARVASGIVGFNWSADRNVAETFASGLCATYPGGGRTGSGSRRDRAPGRATRPLPGPAPARCPAIGR